MSLCFGGHITVTSLSLHCHITHITVTWGHITVTSGHITVTSGHITVTSRSHCHITVTSRSHHCHIIVTSRSHHCRITVTSRTHHCHITVTSLSHKTLFSFVTAARPPLFILFISCSWFPSLVIPTPDRYIHLRDLLPLPMLLDVWFQFPSQVLKKNSSFGLSSHLAENSFGYWRLFSAIYYKRTWV